MAWSLAGAPLHCNKSASYGPVENGHHAMSIRNTCNSMLCLQEKAEFILKSMQNLIIIWLYLRSRHAGPACYS
jgi:hypothetical protein